MPATRTHLPDLLLTALAPLIWGSTYLVTTLFLPPERPFTAALLGVLNIGLFQAMLFVAAYRLTGGLAAILTSTQTLMVLLLTWLVGGQMPPKAAWAWAAAGVAGIGCWCCRPRRAWTGRGWRRRWRVRRRWRWACICPSIGRLSCRARRLPAGSWWRADCFCCQ